MKKLKKLFAVMLSLIMVLAMGITSFADENATITLTGFEDADSLKYMQIIEPDQSLPTGWKFVNDDVAKAFTDVTGQTEQNTLWMLILNKDDQARNNTELNIPDGLEAIHNSQIDRALSAIKSVDGWIDMKDNKSSLSVSKAGVYAFFAEDNEYTYKVATAYVGFGTYDRTPTLVNANVAAKKSKISIEKSTADPDKAVAIGDTVEYTITTFVPYIDVTAENRTFYITDEITGADYVTEEAGKVDGTITLGEGEGATDVIADIVINNNGKGFTIDLDSLVDAENSKGGQKITVKYKAKVTATTVTNTAYGHKSNSNYGSRPVNLYTGSITLTKVDANNANKKLSNAEFTVQKYNADNTTLGEELKFDYAKGVYTYNPESTRENATTVVTDTNGEVKVEGLDVGKYHFTETKAPNGYSINEAGIDIELGKDISKDNVATGIFTVGADGKLTLKDSQLSALPETGGIGTTIFTIVGCGIMIAAAGLFFASRRKENR